jgi:hypothetical protein
VSYLRGLGDVGQPAFFLPDIYELDNTGAAPRFDTLAASANMVGCILKATEGVKYAPAWFTNNWPRLRDAGGGRYGDSWFRGCYHFGRPGDGTAQADFLLAALDRAGGWDSAGDMPPAWDLEGSSWSSAQQIVDVSSDFCAKIRAALGVTPILYTGALVRDLGVTDRMGFSSMWSPHLDMSKAGWRQGEFCLWQYVGDGRYYNPADAKYGYPTSAPGWPGTDMSVVMDMSQGVAATDLDTVRSVLLGKSSATTLLLLTAAAIAAFAFWKYRTSR